MWRHEVKLWKWRCRRDPRQGGVSIMWDTDESCGPSAQWGEASHRQQGAASESSHGGLEGSTYTSKSVSGKLGAQAKTCPGAEPQEGAHIRAKPRGNVGFLLSSCSDFLTLLWPAIFFAFLSLLFQIEICNYVRPWKYASCFRLYRFTAKKFCLEFQMRVWTMAFEINTELNCDGEALGDGMIIISVRIMWVLGEQMVQCFLLTRLPKFMPVLKVLY